ncbi:MAG: hypothetical protein H6553_08365 [Chitinophagales bacterium]|nr:hypothetical protein [Chitinophagales bacterium]
MKTILLKQLPTPMSSYAKVITTLGKKGNKKLPAITIECKNITINESDLKAYNKVCQIADSDFIPATYLHAKSFVVQTELLTQKEAPYPLLGLVHLANQIKQFDKVSKYSPYDIQCSFGDLIVHEKGQAFEVLVKVFQNNALVWQATSVYLFLGKTGTGKELNWQIDDVGEHAIKQSWNLATNLGYQYAKVSGDFNPIHLTPISAKLFGFKQHIIHGMYSKARILGQLEPQIHSDSFNITVSFKTPLYLPNQVIFRYDKINPTQINFDLVDKKQEKPHLKGFIEVIK